MNLQVPDKRVRMKVDWDPYIAFIEFVQRQHLFYVPLLRRRGASPRRPPGVSEEKAGGVDEAGRQGKVGRSGSAPRRGAGGMGGDRARGRPASARALPFPKSTAAEELCAQVWLFIDSKLRLALQDNFAGDEMAAALSAHCRLNARRIGMRQFQAGVRNMSVGLNLRWQSTRGVRKHRRIVGGA